MKTVEDIIADAQAYEWAQPEPLRRELEPPDPYPIDALGDLLAPTAQLLRRVIQSPAEICAQSVLAAATLSTQGHADVLIDGRRFPLSEFFVTVGESGVRKSATDVAALAPVTQRQKDLQVRYREELMDVSLSHDIWKQ